MHYLAIKGKQKLSGCVTISGAKNAALPLLTLTLLSKRAIVIDNIPEVADVKTLLQLLQNLGASFTCKDNVVRIDSTTASGYWAVTAEGLFQFGHSKDHRPDLPQVKVVVASLDPLGMPLVTQVLSGEKADDPLYIPAIAEVRAGVGQRGLLYVGDCKLMALATRAYLQAGGDLLPGSLRGGADTRGDVG